MEVLERPLLGRNMSPSFVVNLKRLISLSEIVKVTHFFVVCCDPGDSKFLELAVNGCADVIIWGEADLRILGRIEDILIRRTAVFIRAFL